MEEPKSEPGDPAATKDDHATPPPCPDRPPTDSGPLDDASSFRVTAPQQPADQHAASAAAAYDARATPDPDAIWSIVLAKFGRGRRGGVDLAAHTFLNPASGVGMVSPRRFATPRAAEEPESEPSDSAAAVGDDASSSSTPISPLWKRLRSGSGTARTTPTSCSTSPPWPPELHAARGAADSQFVEKTIGDGEAGESAATTAGHAFPSSTPPPTPSRVVAGTIASVSLGATSSSRAPAHQSEKRTFIKPGEDPSLPPLPRCHREIKIKGEETANFDISNDKSATLGSTLVPHHEDVKEKVIAKLEGESEEWESLWLEDCIASQRKLLEDKEEKLKRVEEEQQQREVSFQQREWEQKEKEATLQQEEAAILLERMLLRERKAKQEEEEASRAQRINNHRLPRRNNDEGFMGGAGAAYYADHMIRVLAVSGTNARPDLFLPLLQHGQVLGFPPIPADIPLPPSTSVSTTAKLKVDDETWNKRQLGYIFYLGLAVGLVFLVRPLLPHGYDRFLLAGCAMVWGLGSVGLPLGIFGTSRLEKNMSRHIGRLISLCFSGMVIYAIYLLVVSPMGSDSKAYPSPSPSPSPPPTPLGQWEIVFGIIASLVTVGHVVSWVMGYLTGGDRDLEP